MFVYVCVFVCISVIVFVCVCTCGCGSRVSSLLAIIYYLIPSIAAALLITLRMNEIMVSRLALSALLISAITH